MMYLQSAETKKAGTESGFLIIASMQVYESHQRLCFDQKRLSPYTIWQEETDWVEQTQVQRKSMKTLLAVILTGQALP